MRHFWEVQMSDSPSSISKWENENVIRRNLFTVHFEFISKLERKFRRNVKGASHLSREEKVSTKFGGTGAMLPVQLPGGDSPPPPQLMTSSFLWRRQVTCDASRHYNALNCFFPPPVCVCVRERNCETLGLVPRFLLLS